MEALLTHCAGVDVHKEKLAITILIGDPGKKSQVYQFESLTFTPDLEESGKKILEMGVQHVACESTGIYWKPVFNVWNRLGIKITLANGAHVKNVPGRKTDMNDSHWLAQLHRSGLIQASFIPEEEFQSLRSLNRYRKNLIQDCSTIKNRFIKVLEDGNCKLTTVLTDVFGQSGLSILREISMSKTSPEHLIKFIAPNVKCGKEVIIRALTNCLRQDHIFLIKMLLKRYDATKEEIASISIEIEKSLSKYSHTLDQLKEIPGIEQLLAETIFIESTNNMGAFKSEKYFAAWTGIAPGNNESGGKKKRAGTRKGNPNLKAALVQAAMGASRKKDSYFHAKHNALRFRLGSFNKATVAIAHKIAKVVYFLIKDPQQRYQDLGIERVEKKETMATKAVKRLRNLGYEIKLTDLKLRPI